MSETEEMDGLPFDASKLPKELRGLVPLLSDWAVSDDAERGRRISSAPEKVLEALHRDVSPHLAAIDRFCEEKETDRNAYEAPLLGRLAEAAIEAEQELTTRHQDSPSRSRTCPRCDGDGFRRRPHPTVEDGWIPDLCLHCSGTGRVP